ncbi:hypothetical protein [Streptococcus ovis]|uniref:hypothetical protein n=1 Tax=Streptococcus ovis TaxID=82806 RepID=UPI0003684195|nr:hypothetical protein [Streptococcus ovis]
MKEGKQVQSVEEALDNLYEAMACASHEELIAAGLEKRRGIRYHISMIGKFLFLAISFVIKSPIFLYYFLKHWIGVGIITWIIFVIYKAMFVSGEVQFTNHDFSIITIVSMFLSLFVTFSLFRSKE